MPIRLPILIISSLLVMSCSTTRIDQEVNAAYSIKDGESIVVLSDSYHTGNKTENDFMDCLNRSLSKNQDQFNIISTTEFQNIFYPWFEPSTAPQNIEDLPKLFDCNELQVTKWGTIKTDFDTMETNIPGVFAAGDIIRGASLVVWAIRDGREAAISIKNFLEKNKFKKTKIAS